LSGLRKKHKKNGKIPLRVFTVFISFTVFTSLFAFFSLAGFLGFILMTVNQFMAALPQIEEFSPGKLALTSSIYAADGTFIATLHDEENRELVSIDEIPRDLVNAVIAIEDERFYEHQGYDPEGIIRSAIINITSGEIEQGATTITQGYIKNVYIPEEKYDITYDRKIKEIILAYQLEEKYTKQEILEMYLNTMYFGEGAYGVQTAARVYFGKEVKDLDLPECAMIAGLLQSYLHSPYIDEKAAFERRNLVLYNMFRLGYIDNGQYNSAVREPIVTRRSPEASENRFALYFIEHVKQQLISKYGVEKVFEGGLKIYTTLDPQMQVYAEDAIKKILPDPQDPSAALVAMDPKTGYIKALVGGKDFSDLKFNLATQGKRQPGSTFKVFALAAALDQGISPNISFNPNGPLEFEIYGSEPWEVDNYGNQTYNLNEMSVYEATVKSVNVVYSQLIMKVGAEEVARTAMNMGIETPLEAYPAIGLGGLTIGVSPLEVCNAFSTIANYGRRNTPTAILKVIDRDGEILEEYEPVGVPVISPINAYRIIEILQQAMKRGTGTRAYLEDRPCAGKTGTTQKAENAWFTGFTPNLSACVWMGYPEENIRIGTLHDMRVAGGAHPAMIWNLFMKEATKDLPVEDFIRPGDDLIDVEVTIDTDSGDYVLPNRYTEPEDILVREYHYGQEPTRQAPIPEDKIPMMPMVALMPWDLANHILAHMGFENIIYIDEPYSEVPSGYTHRQDPMWDQPVEIRRKITVWVNP
jgi:penicillin-binding protein 1A